MPSQEPRSSSAAVAVRARIATGILPAVELTTVREGAEPFGEPIHAYSRADALADGVLVDVTRQASPAEMHGGFTVPVAVTAALWSAIEAIPSGLRGNADPRGRLHDVLWMAALACRRGVTSCAFFASFAGSHGADFQVHLPYAGTRRRVQTLRVEVGPDDHGAPCVTIGFPEDF